MALGLADFFQMKHYVKSIGIFFIASYNSASHCIPIQPTSSTHTDLLFQHLGGAHALQRFPVSTRKRMHGFFYSSSKNVLVLSSVF
jgi:hypothetical protein